MSLPEGEVQEFVALGLTGTLGIRRGGVSLTLGTLAKAWVPPLTSMERYCLGVRNKTGCQVGIPSKPRQTCIRAAECHSNVPNLPVSSTNISTSSCRITCANCGSASRATSRQTPPTAATCCRSLAVLASGFATQL